MTLKTNQVFGEYTVLKRIGAGGMAEVYMVRPLKAPEQSPPMALRRILPALSDNPGFVKMFLQEAKIVGSLKHKNIIRLNDFGKIDDDYFMVTDFVWGVTLQEIIDRCREEDIPLPYVHAARIVADISDGLEHAHNLEIEGKSVSIVHLDINPRNIMVDFDGNARLLDFGVAHALYEGNHKKYNELQGTYAYMSPEQCQELDVDGRSDLFSIGIILYELTTLTPLFGRHGSEYLILKSITDGIIPPPSNLVKGFPRTLEDIILLSLKVSAIERYQHAAELRDALEHYLTEIEFDPMQESLPSWLKRIFRAKYDEFATVMEPSRVIEGSYSLPSKDALRQEKELQKRLGGPLTAGDERDAAIGMELELEEIANAQDRASSDGESDLPPAEVDAQSPRPPQRSRTIPDSDLSKVRADAAQPASFAPSASPDAFEVTQPQDDSPAAPAASPTRAETKTPPRPTVQAAEPAEKPEPVIKPSSADRAASREDTLQPLRMKATTHEILRPGRGHYTYTVLALLVFLAIIGFLVQRNLSQYEPYTHWGQLYVYTSADNGVAKGERPVSITLDSSTTLSAPIEGHFIPPGKHQIVVDDPRFRSEQRIFSIDDSNPIRTIFLPLQPAGGTPPQEE